MAKQNEKQSRLLGIHYTENKFRPAAQLSTTRNHKHCWATAKPRVCRNSLFELNLSCNSGLVVYAYRLDFICIIYGGQKTAKILQFRPNFILGGGCWTLHLYWSRPNLARDSRRWSTFTCQISFESIYCVTIQGWTTIILGKFWHVGKGAPVPTPFYRWGPNLVC